MAPNISSASSTRSGPAHTAISAADAGGEPVLLDGFVDGAHRIPGRRRGQLGVDQQHRGLVLQRLEGADRFAELFAGADVVRRCLDARRTVPADAHAARATTTQRARSVSIPDSTAVRGDDVVGEM